MNFKQIHLECGWHEKTVKSSKICGCFNCLKTFPPSEIVEWIEESSVCPRGAGKTAVCPYCEIDTVLPESNLYKLSSELLNLMNNEYCQ